MGQAVWSNKINALDKQKILESLRLPQNTGPANWWLTEFEDQWQYGIAPDDLYFARNLDQKTIKKVASATGPWPMDISIFVIAIAGVSPSLNRRLRRFRRRD